MLPTLRTALRVATAALALTVVATPAAAQQYSATTAGGPTWTRPLQPCNGLSAVGVGVRYHVQPVWAASAGLRTFTSLATSPSGWDNFLFLYANAFDPAAQLTGCVAGNDDGPDGIGQSQFSFDMLANTQYFLVTTGFEPGEEGAFTNTVTGGTVTFGLINQNVVPEPGTYALMMTGLAGLGAVARRRRERR